MVIPAYEIIVLEFIEFLQDMKNNALNYGYYVGNCEYKYDYTQDEITFAKQQFYNLASAYLKCTEKTDYTVKICSKCVEVIRNIERGENGVD